MIIETAFDKHLHGIGTETPNARGVFRHRDPKYTRCGQAQRPQIHEVCSGTETPNTRGVFRHRDP